MELFQTQQHWVSLTAYLRELRDKQQKHLSTSTCSFTMQKQTQQ